MRVRIQKKGTKPYTLYSVVDPGCLSRIQVLKDPGSGPYQRIYVFFYPKRYWIPDPGFATLIRNLEIGIVFSHCFLDRRVSLDPREEKRLDPYEPVLKSETSTPSSSPTDSGSSLSPATRQWRGCSTQGTVTPPPSPLQLPSLIYS